MAAAEGGNKSGKKDRKKSKQDEGAHINVLYRPAVFILRASKPDICTSSKQASEHATTQPTSSAAQRVRD